MSRGMSQVEFADAIHRKPPTVALYERGTRLPSVQILSEIARFFNVPYEEVYYSAEENHENALADEWDATHIDADDEIWKLREDMRRNPALRTLWDFSRQASPKEISQLNAIIRAIRGENNEDN